MEEETLPKIHFWAADTSGCGYYRCGLPAQHLRTQGLAHTVASTKLDLSVDWDIIVAQRISGIPQSELWQELAQRDVLAVYEIDDDLFSVPKTNQSHEHYQNPLLLQQISDNLAASHLVTVTTDALAAVVKEHTDAPVAVLPNCIDLSVLPQSLVDQSALQRVGWGGSTTHLGDLQPVAEHLGRAVNRVGAEFVTIGADYTELVGADKKHHLGWEKNIVDYYKLLDFQVGVAPLKSDTFNQSKSPVKALEYASRGIVTLASDTGPYSGFVRHGETGFLIRKRGEWVKYMDLLAREPELRNLMALSARNQAKSFDINHRAKDWLEAYTAVKETR